MKAPKNEHTDFEKHPEGWVVGVCSRVIDLGTHWHEGKQKYMRKIMLAFESEKTLTSGEFNGEPFLLFANFNYSMYKNAKLCEFIENWRGKRFETQDQADAFDLAKLLGQPAFMNIVHNGQYVNINTIGPLPDDKTAPAIKGKHILIDQDDLDPKEVEKLTDKMKQRVLAAQEQQQQNKNDVDDTAIQSQPQSSDFDDDIPF